MRRRGTLRPSFVVTFALGAAAIATGCPNGSTNSGNPPFPSTDGGGDGSSGEAGCPFAEPAPGAPCDLPSGTQCVYATCNGYPDEWSVCQQGTWSPQVSGCNPPAPVYEAGPDVDDAAPDIFESGADVHDGGPDSEGQDGGHD